MTANRLVTAGDMAYAVSELVRRKVIAAACRGIDEEHDQLLVASLKAGGPEDVWEALDHGGDCPELDFDPSWCRVSGYISGVHDALGRPDYEEFIAELRAGIDLPDWRRRFPQSLINEINDERGRRGLSLLPNVSAPLADDVPF